MIACIVFTIFLLTLCQAVQITFNSPPTKNNVDLIKDTAQTHYESMIDDILSQHNEDLLTELSMVIKKPQEMYAIMKPQAELLASSIQDVCVAQMPGMIANQVHELSSSIYSSVDLAVSTYWKSTDSYYRQLVLNAIHKEGHWEQAVLNKLVSSLELLNMDITDSIIDTVDQFNMLNKLKISLLNCQSTFADTPVAHEMTLAEKMWKAILVSFHLSNNPIDDSIEQQKGFMGKYIFELRSDIQSEMYSRIYELARSIYEDLAFSA